MKKKLKIENLVKFWNVTCEKMVLKVAKFDIFAYPIPFREFPWPTGCIAPVRCCWRRARNRANPAGNDEVGRTTLCLAGIRKLGPSRWRHRTLATVRLTILTPLLRQRFLQKQFQQFQLISAIYIEILMSILRVFSTLKCQFQHLYEIFMWIFAFLMNFENVDFKCRFYHFQAISAHIWHFNVDFIIFKQF